MNEMTNQLTRIEWSSAKTEKQSYDETDVELKT